MKKAATEEGAGRKEMIITYRYILPFGSTTLIGCCCVRAVPS